MKKLSILLILIIFKLALNSQVFQTTGDQYITGKLSIYPSGITPVNTYNGNLVITKPSASGQYINLIRTGNAPWSIGTVYNTNNFAIGNGQTTDSYFNNPYFIINTTGQVGIGTTSPYNNFEVVNSNSNILDVAGFYNTYTYGNSNRAETRINLGKIEGTNRQPMGAIGALPLSNYDSSNGILLFYTRNTQNMIERLRIDHNGKVGIGTTSPDEMLTVNGKIHAKEVIISLTGPLADYVFDPDYQLTPLLEVEQFVNKHRHLPEIPSASEVEKNGLSMGEMQNKLLQKIEELTLYIIQQNNRISELEKKLSK